MNRNSQDDLIGEIEQFLADGGEPADTDDLLDRLRQVAGDPDVAQAWYAARTPHEQRLITERLSSRLTEIEQMLAPVIDAVAEAMPHVAEAITQFAEQVTAAFGCVAGIVADMMAAYELRRRRVALAWHLQRWGMPGFMAAWVANIWPQRWLPVLPVPPPLW